MSYTPSSKLPSLHHLQISTPTAPNPTLSAPLPKGQTTIYFTYPMYDRTGTKLTGDVLIGVKNSDSYVETMYIGTGGIAGDGLSATVVRGIRLEGLDYTTGDSTLEEDFSAGDAVFCNISGVIQDMAEAAIKGTIATGGANFVVGTEAGAETVTFYRTTTAGVRLGVFRWFVTSGKAQFSNDGTRWVNCDDVTASDLVKVSAADTTAQYLYDKIGVSGTLSKAITNPAGVEVLTLTNTASDTVVDTPYTASEDIAIGHPLSKTTTNDTVENTIISTLATAGTESTFSSAGTITSPKSCYCADGKVAVIYHASTANLGYIIIGTVAEDKTITWGTPVSLGDNISSPNLTDIKYMSDDKVVMIYINGTTAVTYARVATVSGTVPTLGAEKEVYAVNSPTSVAVAVIDTDKIVVAYNQATTKHGMVACATVSGTTIGTFGTPVEILTTGAGDETSNLAIAKNSTDKAIVFCQNDTTSKGKGTLVIASGTTLAVATEVEIDANASTWFSADYITDGKVLVTWKGGASGYLQARVASVAGLVLTYPTAVTAVNAVAIQYGYGSVVCASATTAFTTYYEQGNYGKFNKISISGTTLTVGTQYSINSGAEIREPVVAKVNSKTKVLIAYSDSADTNKGKAEVFQEYDNSASLVGFATSSVSSGASVNSRSKGVIGSQSGLTAGTTYYLSGSGLSSSNTTGIKLGVGKNATNLDIDIDTDTYSIAVLTDRTDLTAGETVTAGHAVRFGVEDVSIASYTGAGTADLTLYGNTWKATRFSATLAGISYVKLYIKRVGTCAGLTATAFIRASTGGAGGIPTGADLVSIGMSAPTIDTNYDWVTFTFSNSIALTVGTDNYEVCLKLVGGDGSNYLMWRHQGGGGVDGEASSADGGSSWTEATGDCGTYDAYYGFAGETATKVYLTQYPDVLKQNCIGFSKEGGILNDPISVQTHGIIGGLSGLTANTTYYIEADGNLATTGTTKIGRSLSTTELMMKPLLWL
jgi:hypothetical protein